jgi:hypothetical protein
VGGGEVKFKAQSSKLKGSSKAQAPRQTSRCCIFGLGLWSLSWILSFELGASAAPARIHVFVALADNRAQGIVPVPDKIGNGDDAKNNLYWGTADALPHALKADADWKATSVAAGTNAAVIERRVWLHKSGKWEVVADAYRGKEIKRCTLDFFAALTGKESREQLPLVAYIGHNGLMDFELPAKAVAAKGPGRRAIVLCCKSRDYFSTSLRQAGAEPLLLTTQLMYPAGAVLRDVLAGWAKAEDASQLHARAAKAYALNQKISVKAAGGVFVPAASK